MPDVEKRVFISSSPEDRGFAEALAERMTTRGASVFFDTNLVPGSHWGDTLRSELERTSALVLVIPARGLEHRNYALFEAGAAKALGKPVLAVLPPGRSAASVEMPSDIAGLIVLDVDRRSLDDTTDTLLHAVPPTTSFEAA